MAGRKVVGDALCDVLELGAKRKGSYSKWSATELRMRWQIGLGGMEER